MPGFVDLAGQVVSEQGLRCLVTAPRRRRPVVVLVHGLSESLDHWLPVVSGLRDELQVVAFDLPGCGDSPRLPELTRPQLATRLASLVRSVAPSGRYVVVAHSLGVIAGADLVARLGRQAAAFVLVNATLHRASEALHLRVGQVGLGFTARVWRLVAAGHVRFSARLAGAVARWPFLRRLALSHVLWRPEDVPAATLRETLRHTGRNHGLGMVRLALQTEYLDLLRQVRCDVRVVFGERDWLIAKEDLDRTSEVARVVATRAIEGCGHWSIVERTAEVARFIRESAAAEAKEPRQAR